MIAIIDYGMGNLRSVEKAFAKVGHEARITSDPAIVAAADKIVLPGVGAFEDAIRAMKDRNLADPVRAAVATDKPLLGICLGLQLLFDRSLEGGEHEGLGIVPGQVVRFPAQADLKVPHMGWNEVRQRGDAPIFQGIPDGTHFYFVHSYYVVPQDRAVVAGETDYPTAFTAAVRRGRLYATQFHPEKSQAQGLRLLKNFAELG